VDDAFGRAGMQSVTLRISNGAKILVWREDEVFHAQRSDRPVEPPQSCLGLDLFEVIADLAGLDLDRGAEAAEVVELSERAQRKLGAAPVIALSEWDPLEEEDHAPRAGWGSE
jgi:hypothetical protein